MIYFDSSALVKRYMREEGTEFVETLCENERLIATSKLTYPEILSALARKRRSKEISDREYEAIFQKFLNDWAGITVLEFHDEIFAQLKRLIEVHSLRAADAVHLASALWLKESVNEQVVFVASDLELLKAADRERLDHIDPSAPVR